MVTAVGCDNHWQIKVGNVTQPMTVNLTVHIFSVHVYPVPKKIDFIQIRLNYKDAGTYNISIEATIQNNAQAKEFLAANRVPVISNLYFAQNLKLIKKYVACEKKTIK